MFYWNLTFNKNKEFPLLQVAGQEAEFGASGSRTFVLVALDRGSAMQDGA